MGTGLAAPLSALLAAPLTRNRGLGPSYNVMGWICIICPQCKDESVTAINGMESGIV